MNQARLQRSVSIIAMVLCLMVGGLAPANDLRSGPSAEVRRQEAAPAVDLLQKGNFAGAEEMSAGVLLDDAGNSLAAAVHALASYQMATETLTDTFMHLEGPDSATNRATLITAAETLEGALAGVLDDLSAAVTDPEFSLKLCLACWKHDWNRDGTIDLRDQRLMEVELDATGAPYAEDDPKRRPTFRFDAGDVRWAQAMVSFQRAFLNLALAYEWPREEEIQTFFQGQKLVIPLRDASRITRARGLILEGLAHAHASRKAYLAETDDEGEWVPNPRQKNHPLPLEVTEDLYELWGTVLTAVERLVRSEEGIRLADLTGLSPTWDADPPAGYIDVGRLLDPPSEIVIDMARLSQVVDTNTREGIEATFDILFGEAYVDELMASPLPELLQSRWNEIQRGESTFSTKMRYLLWLN